MSIGLIENVQTMSPEASETESRSRIDLRISPSLRRRIDKQADRFGLTMTAYIHLALIERLERDESSSPKKCK